jgi:hypothetical protein
MKPMNITELTPGQLRKAAKLKEQMARLQKELNRLLGTSAPAVVAARKQARKRKMSAAGRARISAAAKARWARIKAATKK